MYTHKYMHYKARVFDYISAIKNATILFRQIILLIFCVHVYKFISKHIHREAKVVINQIYNRTVSITILFCRSDLLSYFMVDNAVLVNIFLLSYQVPITHV